MGINNGIKIGVIPKIYLYVILCFSACNEASRLFIIHKNCRLNSGWPLDGAKTPPAQTHSALNPAALTFLEQLRFISLTARSCCPSQTELTLLKEDCKRKQTNKQKKAHSASIVKLCPTVRLWVQLQRLSGGWEVVSQTRRTRNFYRLSSSLLASNQQRSV